MIVRCARLYNHMRNQYQTSSASLTVGKEYIVIEMDFVRDVIYYRVFADRDINFTSHPILVRVDDFEVVSGKIPANWVLKACRGNTAILGPEKWVNHEYWEDDFWDDWSNGNPKAIACFHEEYAIIKAIDE